MKGQWIGNYTGSNQGQIIVELDEQSDCYLGWAYLFDSREGYLHSSALIKTSDKQFEQEFEVGVGPIDANVPGISSWDNIKSQFSDFQFPYNRDRKNKIGWNLASVGMDNKHWYDRSCFAPQIKRWAEIRISCLRSRHLEGIQRINFHLCLKEVYFSWPTPII